MAESDHEGVLQLNRSPKAVEEQVAAFVRSPDPAEFEALAHSAFELQYREIAPFRRLCERRAVGPSTFETWSQAPAVPVLSFKTLELASRAAVETFRSSGTTSDRRSVHFHGFPGLYRTVIDCTFPEACRVDAPREPFLSLIPERAQAPDSSLSFMIDHVMAAHGSAESRYAVGPRGVDTRAARTFLAARQRDRQPTLILATSLALAELLDGLDRLNLRLRLPAGSRVFDTGGSKGRARELSPEVQADRLLHYLDIRPSAVVGEYGMTELTSHFYTGALMNGDPDLFVPPPWTRVRALDCETLAPVADGEVGILAIFDLANLSSAIHLLTEDLGIVSEHGFRLVGRAAGAELRGCSLTAEELASS